MTIQTNLMKSLIATLATIHLIGCGAFISPADSVDPDGSIPKEAACLDLWSLVHFSSGYYIGTQTDVGSFGPTVGVLSGYEVIEREIWPEFDESILNQRCDIVVGTIGWMVESLSSD